MNSPKKSLYDITIAGAGPAGSVLAYTLAKQGIRVLLLEKHKLPRDKVCAGGVTVRAASILPFDFKDIILNTIYGVRLSFKMVPQKVRTFDKPLAYMVMRDRFDYLLASHANRAGATLEEETEVKDIEIEQDYVRVKTNRDVFSTPLLVGADGANSAVVHALGIRNGFDFGLGLNCHIAVPPEIYSGWDGLMGLDYGIPGGYAWVFPKNNSLAVGAGSSFRESKKLRNYTLRLTESYELGEVKKQDIRGHLMPLKKAGTPLVHNRVLLVGDAAGMIDPLSGEGLYYGLKSTCLAAGSIIKFLEGKEPDLSEYDAAVNRELMPELKTARTIQKLNSLTPRLFFHYLEENDRVWGAFCGMLRGDRTYVSLKNRLSPPLRFLFRVF
jgi:geranylgeranyl reductase family protein